MDAMIFFCKCIGYALGIFGIAVLIFDRVEAYQYRKLMDEMWEKYD